MVNPDCVALQYTCPTPGAVHWATLQDRPQHWYVKGALIGMKERKKKRTKEKTNKRTNETIKKER